MSLLKKGVRFNSQDTNEPMSIDEIPHIIMNLTPTGIRRAAIIAFEYMASRKLSLNKALEIMEAKQEGANA